MASTLSVSMFCPFRVWPQREANSDAVSRPTIDLHVGRCLPYVVTRYVPFGWPKSRVTLRRGSSKWGLQKSLEEHIARTEKLAGECASVTQFDRQCTT